MRATRGFVLVNALVLVAALSAAAFYLLSRAEGTRLRTGAAQQAQQMAFYLDAGEALAITQLLGDRSSGLVDHPAEAWAKAYSNLELDGDLLGGRLSGQMVDLQGLFNLNWLAGSQDAILQAAFRTLCIQRGVAPQQAEKILKALSAEQPAAPAAGALSDLVGGPMVMLDQLLDLPGLDAKTFARLATFTTVLPGDSALNINAASAEILAAVLPGSNAPALASVVQSARTRPFTSIEAFVEALPGIVPQEALSDLNLDRFSIGSDWFQAKITLQLEGRIARRIVTLHRQPLPAGIKVAYRLDNWN